MGSQTVGHNWATFTSLEEDRCSSRTCGYILLVLSHSVVSNSLQLLGLQLTWLLCPWNFPGKNTGVGRHFLLQGSNIPTQGSNPGLLCLLHCHVGSLPLYHLGSPIHCILLIIYLFINHNVWLTLHYSARDMAVVREARHKFSLKT